jgi:hypothetical protein
LGELGDLNQPIDRMSGRSKRRILAIPGSPLLARSKCAAVQPMRVYGGHGSVGLYRDRTNTILL